LTFSLNLASHGPIFSPPYRDDVATRVIYTAAENHRELNVMPVTAIFNPQVDSSGRSLELARKSHRSRIRTAVRRLYTFGALETEERRPNENDEGSSRERTR
jgi:hypothetical protein